MLKLSDGQCGMCAHYGEHGAAHAQQLVQIRIRGEAPADMVEACGHPQHEGLHLRTSPIASCDGFTPAKAS